MRKGNFQGKRYSMENGNDSNPVRTGLTPAGKGGLLIFAGSVCISFAAFFVKGASIDSSAVAFYRLLFGAAALFLLAGVQRLPLLPCRSLLPLLAVASLFFGCDMLIWHKSILLVGPGIATIVVNFQVILLAVYGVAVLGETMSLPQKLSIPLALAGLALLLGLHEKRLPGDIWLGVGLALLAACFYAGYVLTLRRSQMIPVKLSPVSTTAWISALTCLVALVYCLGTGVSLDIPDYKTLSILAMLGLLCQSLGWVLLSRGLPLLPPFRAGLIMLMQPALSYVWDMIFFGADAGAANIFGACLAIAAIGMGVYSPRKSAGSS